jgi:hypothetical protein
MNMRLQETGYEEVERIHLPQYTYDWRTATE